MSAVLHDDRLDRSVVGRAELEAGWTERTLVVLQYAPVLDTIAGEPLEIYPFLGSSRLAETIDRFR